MRRQMVDAADLSRCTPEGIDPPRPRAPQFEQTAQVPPNVPKLTMAASLSVVDYDMLLIEQQTLAEKTYPNAQVAVFAVEKVAFIETAHRRKHSTWHQQKHASEPVCGGFNRLRIMSRQAKQAPH